MKYFMVAFAFLAYNGVLWVEQQRQLGDVSAINGSLPNVFAVIIGGCLMVTVGVRDSYKAALGFCVGVILYEFLQVFIRDRTFDAIDILASLFGLTVFYGGYFLCQQLFHWIKIAYRRATTSIPLLP